jgi:hypothetical protein
MQVVLLSFLKVQKYDPALSVGLLGYRDNVHEIQLETLLKISLLVIKNKNLNT